MPHIHRMPVRVRYPEVDPMGRVHHSVYLVYFEMGRTEYMRARGVTYAEMERAGQFIAVVGADVKYKAGALYDDPLIVETWVQEVRGARVFFGNRVLKPGPLGETLVAEAVICGALLDRSGHPRRFSEEETARMMGPPMDATASA